MNKLPFIIVTLGLLASFNCSTPEIDEKSHVNNIGNEKVEPKFGTCHYDNNFPQNIDNLENPILLKTPYVYKVNPPTYGVEVTVSYNTPTGVGKPLSAVLQRQITYNSVLYDAFPRWASFKDVCACGHADYWIVYYWLPKCTKSPTKPKSMIHDMGYIKPIVKKLANGKYMMWVTHLFLDYTNSAESYYQKGFFNYKIKAFISDDSFNWDPIPVSDEIAYIGQFSENEPTPSDDNGGVFLSDIYLNSTEAFPKYYAIYLGRPTSTADDNGWTMNFAYTTNNEPTYWNRKSFNSLYQILNKSSKGFDSRTLGLGSMMVEKGKYKVWYTGYDDKTSAIGFAYSMDGFSNWIKNGNGAVLKGVPLKFDERGTMDPFVIKDGSTYRMYYTGFNGSTYRIGLAYSQDGTYFKYYSDTGENPTYDHRPIFLSNSNVRYPYAMIDVRDGKKYFRLYYCEQVSRVNGIAYDPTTGTALPPQESLTWQVRWTENEIKE